MCWNVQKKMCAGPCGTGKKQGILDYTEYSEAGEASTQTSCGSSAVPAREASAPAVAAPSRSDKEFKELLFVAEQYLGKTQSASDIDTIVYFFDVLGMSADLIEYLIEYCVENNHKSMHYIRAVALSWDSQNIRTVEEAKANTMQYHKNFYSVLKAYGIGGRSPRLPRLPTYADGRKSTAFPWRSSWKPAGVP